MAERDKYRNYDPNERVVELQHEVEELQRELAEANARTNQGAEKEAPARVIERVVEKPVDGRKARPDEVLWRETEPGQPGLHVLTVAMVPMVNLVIVPILLVTCLVFYAIVSANNAALGGNLFILMMLAGSAAFVLAISLRKMTVTINTATRAMRWAAGSTEGTIDLAAARGVTSIPDERYSAFSRLAVTLDDGSIAYTREAPNASIEKVMQTIDALLRGKALETTREETAETAPEPREAPSAAPALEPEPTPPVRGRPIAPSEEPQARPLTTTSPVPRVRKIRVRPESESAASTSDEEDRPMTEPRIDTNR